jgi:hypothetical protein
MSDDNMERVGPRERLEEDAAAGGKVEVFPAGAVDVRPPDDQDREPDEPILAGSEDDEL